MGKILLKFATKAYGVLSLTNIVDISNTFHDFCKKKKKAFSN